MFESAIRLALFGRQASKELKAVREKLGENIPFLGIYTYAEQAPLSAINYLGKTYFNSHTLTLLGIAE